MAVSNELDLTDKTKAFFEQEVKEIGRQFVESDLVIALPDKLRQIRLAYVEAFPGVGARWGAIRQMEPGQLWNPQYIRVVQSLVVAKGSGRFGACVRLIEADYFDSVTGVFVSELQVGAEKYGAKESDIARYLGLQKNDMSTLKFLDDLNTLYLVR